MLTREGYRWRTLTAADTPAWSDLVALLAEHDGTNEVYSAQDLAEELEFPGVDPGLDTIAVISDGGVEGGGSADGGVAGGGSTDGGSTDGGSLVGFGQVFFREALIDGHAAANTSGGVHPDHRGRGIGTELVHRLESAARRGNARRHPGIATELRVDCGVEVAQARALFATEGFTETRVLNEMTHDLVDVDVDVDDAAPLSPRLRPYSSATDRDAVRAAHNEAFADHWRFAPRTAEEWKAVAGQAFRPDLSFVQPGPDGTIEGYILCAEYVPGELYVMILGVREQLRGLGVGAALLRMALSAAVAAGYERAALGVDTDNSTGALRLYESLGFRVAHATVASLKTLLPG